jgi:hypothetical protein
MPVAGASLLIVLRVYVFATNTIISPNHTLIEVVSVAIWDRNKAVMTTTIGLWVINSAFLIQGKFYSSSGI